MKNLPDWVSHISALDLPVLRRTLVELARLGADQDHATAKDIAEIVSHDPFMTIKILRTVNQRRSRHFDTEITTLEHAVMMLGIPPFFRAFARLRALEDVLRDKPEQLQGLLRRLSRSRHAGFQAREWATLRVDIDAQEVYVAALLCDLAEMLVCLVAYPLAERVERGKSQGSKPPEQIQRDVLGFSYLQLRSALAARWSLPELLTDLMDEGNASRPRVLGVLLAVSVAHHAERGWWQPELAADYAAIATWLRMPENEVPSLIHRIAIIPARGWDWYHCTPAATWLVMEPGDWPGESGDEPADQPRKTPYTSTVPHPEIVERIIQTLERQAPQMSVHDLVMLALQGMEEGIGLSRSLFALMTPDRDCVKAKYIHGAKASSHFRAFEFFMDDDNLLFPRLMTRLQSLWLGNSNRSYLQPLIPFSLQDVLSQGDWFAMSVFVQDQPVGLFLADLGEAHGQLDEARYLLFKRLCIEAGKGIACHIGKLQG